MRPRRLIDASYVATASGEGAGPRRDYGYLWWVEGDGQFSAIGGVGNCYVHVMPSKKLVTALLGADAGLGRGGSWAEFRSVIAAVD